MKDSPEDVAAQKKMWTCAGRDTRAQFWMNQISGYIGLGIIAGAAAGTGDLAVMCAIIGIGGLLIGWLLFTSYVRRLHDTNRGAGHIIFAIFVPVVGWTYTLFLAFICMFADGTVDG